VTDGGFGSVRLLDQMLDLAAVNQGRHVILVRNFGRSTSFDQFEKSAEKQRLIEIGGSVLDLPALDADTMYEVDRFGSSFWAAVHVAADERAISPMARRRIRRWLERCTQQLETIRDLL
jgi:hypothetical protein